MYAHTHKAMGRDDYVRTDGIREIYWKCLCGLEEKRFFQDGECIGVRYRYGGRWIEAWELVSLTVPVQLCPQCGGDNDDCDNCGGVGVLDTDGGKVVAPPPPRPVRVVP